MKPDAFDYDPVSRRMHLLTGGPDETAGFGVAVKVGLRRFGKTDEPSSSERAPVSNFDYDPERGLG